LRKQSLYPRANQYILQMHSSSLLDKPSITPVAVQYASNILCKRPGHAGQGRFCIQHPSPDNTATSTEQKHLPCSHIRIFKRERLVASGKSKRHWVGIQGPVLHRAAPHVDVTAPRAPRRSGPSHMLRLVHRTAYSALATCRSHIAGIAVNRESGYPRIAKSRLINCCWIFPRTNINLCYRLL
jgi:hypothetical protein